ncbi:hypothetical protein LXL04_009249 [Taraxacum kok-saghyz]
MAPAPPSPNSQNAKTSAKLTPPFSKTASEKLKTPWASAAITDEYTCIDEFSDMKVSPAVKKKIRSSIEKITGYMKSIPSQRPARQQVTTTPLGQSQRVHVPGEKKAGEGLEFEVYNQGMSKTELCNKWQETGACPYGDNLDYMEWIRMLKVLMCRALDGWSICCVSGGQEDEYRSRRITFCIGRFSRSIFCVSLIWVLEDEPVPDSGVEFVASSLKLGLEEELGSDEFELF